MEQQARVVGHRPEPAPWIPCMRLDASKTFEIPSESFDFVYSEHMIEHVSFEDGRNMLEECNRILRPFGVIRIVTPSISEQALSFGYPRNRYPGVTSAFNCSISRSTSIWNRSRYTDLRVEVKLLLFFCSGGSSSRLRESRTTLRGRRRARRIMESSLSEPRDTVQTNKAPVMCRGFSVRLTDPPPLKWSDLRLSFVGRVQNLS
jgi:SAM-dependent methyltransferase